MFVMDYRTRKGTTSLSGKARIFLTCHREDREIYLEETANNLLDYGNYAIWFYDYNPREDTYHQEVVREYLGNTQLLVVLVTNRLLNSPGMIAGYEIAVAQKQNIPILPIAPEEIDNERFAQVFGNMHYMAPYLEDGTGIPYERKLKTYLDNILVGDEQIRNIKAAFRKKVFLSYRKKDRRSAEELMTLIHHVDCCYDVGIWYDEQLNPGRDFENEIQQEIESCDVFVINVTPSILEGNNYVIREEIPCALKNKKDILPIQMVPADEEAWQREYPEIPVVREEDGSAKKRISELLAAESNIERDMNKLFYLGLAYLDGFYVEKRQEFAKKLIAGAAERGILEATEKLYMMYREGQGVERDFEEALKWKKFLIQQLESQLRYNAEQTTIEKYHNACLTLGQELQREGKYTEAETYYRKMLDLADAHGEKDFWSMYRKSVCIMALADVETEKRHLNSAVKMYIDTIKSRLDLLDRFGDDKAYMPIIRRALGVAYLKLGDCERVQGYYKSVLDAYNNCLRIRDAAVRDLTDGDSAEYEARRDLAVIQLRLGEAYQFIAENGEEPELASKAYHFYNESLKIRIGLMDELRTKDAKRDLAVVWCRLAELEMKCDMLEDAGEHLRQGLTLRRELAENGGTLQDKKNLAMAYRLYAEYSQAMLKKEENFTQGLMRVVESYQEARKHMQEVAERTGSISDRRALASIFDGLGEFYKKTDQPELATMQLYYSVTIYEEIQEQSGELISAGDFASLEEHALALYRLGTADKTPKHREYLLKSYTLWKGLATLEPGNERYQNNVDYIAKMLTNT